jgi:addiction module antidote protein HigA
MTNYIEYNDMIVFHPGYYIEEIIEQNRFTQKDFAKRLDTTEKTLSNLINGKQSLSTEIASKLSKMLGTSIKYWQNLQDEYDALMYEINSKNEILEERNVFQALDYSYFVKNYNLPSIPRNIEGQIKAVREFLSISTLTTLTKIDVIVNFRNTQSTLTVNNIIRANTMVQIAINQALKIKAPKFNKELFEKAISYALTLTREHDTFYPKIKEAFFKAGVLLIVLPNISGSKTNGATRKIGDNIMLMVNDRKLNSDTFWFTLFHEIGHIVNKDYGISFEKEIGEMEIAANKYAENSLIPFEEYQHFIENNKFDLQSIQEFADKINRAPGIILGRLQNDKKIGFDNKSLSSLRCKYKVVNTTI